MLLESITFHNYRQFKGNQTIKFSTDKKKNVTVIIGKNTFGKTTIVQSFIWCLYGTTDFKNKRMLNAEVRNNLENSPVGTSEYASVLVRFTHNDTKYLAERRENVSVKSLKVLETTNTFNIYECDNYGNTLPVSTRSPENIINDILPQNLSDYFFFWGERIETLSEKSNLTDAVKQFLGLDTLASCRDHLELAIKKMNKDIPVSGDAEIAELKTEIDVAERHITKLENELNEAKNNKDYYANKAKELYETLMSSENKVLNSMQNEYRQKTAQLETFRSQLEDTKKTFFKHFNDENNYPYFLSNTIEKKAVKLLKDNPEPTIGWKYIDINVINEIIKRGECICGNPVCDGSKALKHLNDQKKIVAPNVTGGIINSFIEEAERRESFNQNYYKLIHEDYKKIISIQDTILELELSLEKLSKVVFNKTDVRQIKAKYDEATDNKISSEIKINSLQEQIQSDKNDIEQYQTKIQALSNKNIKLKKYSRQLDITRQLYTLISNQYKENEQILKAKLEEYVNKDFESVYNGERKIVIDDKYVSHPLSLVGGVWEETGTTPGLETVKNFAYITGLVRCAKESISGDDEDEIANPNTYPLVLDAPFSQADEKHVPAICGLISNVAEQIILVVMEKDWEYAKDVLRSKTGKYYSLEKISETHSEIKEDK